MTGSSSPSALLLAFNCVNGVLGHSALLYFPILHMRWTLWWEQAVPQD